MTVLLLSSEVAGLNFETHETFSIWVQWANRIHTYKLKAKCRCMLGLPPNWNSWLLPCVNRICEKIPKNCNGPTKLLHQPLTAGLMTQHLEVSDPRPQTPPWDRTHRYFGDLSGIYLSGARSTITLQGFDRLTGKNGIPFNFFNSYHFDLKF